MAEHTDQVSSAEGNFPMTSPQPSHDAKTILPSAGNALEPESQDLKREQDHVQDNSRGSLEDDSRTSPRETIPQEEAPSTPGIASIYPRPEASQLVQSHSTQHFSDSSANVSTSTDDDYFASQSSQNPLITDLATRRSPGQGSSTNSRDSSTPASPNNQSIVWKDFSQNQFGTFSTHTPRPTSVPNFQSKNLSRRREGPEYPNYPDQSFRALQDQQYPPPYRPTSPRPLRTRSSQSSPFSPSDSQTSIDLPRIPSGAKTAGNTPAQSPGLFSPTFVPKRQWPGEPDEARSTTPMLHPTHHKAPKEYVDPRLLPFYYVYY